LHQRKKLRLRLESVQKKIKDRTNPNSSVIARFILFFELFGTKAKIAVRILRLMVEKNCEAPTARKRRLKKLRSQTMIDVDSSSSEAEYILDWNTNKKHGLKQCSEMSWDFDQNPFLPICHWLEYGAHHREMKERQLVDVETQTEELKCLTNAVSECKSIDFLLYTDEVICFWLIFFLIRLMILYLGCK
jgi:hypothetical protein